MQMERLIPLISAMVYPNAFLCSMRTFSKLLSCKPVKDEEIIITNLSFFSKNAYFKWDGNGLSLRVGGSLMDGFGLDFNSLSKAS